MTINDPHIIYTLLSNNGIFPEDPQCTSIWQYINTYGKVTQAVYYDNYELYESEYVQNPVLLWDKDEGLTDAGKVWISNYNK